MNPNDAPPQSVPHRHEPLSLPGLEAVYDHLAQAIDGVPAARTELFLVKLALLLAQDAGDAARFEALCAEASRDL